MAWEGGEVVKAVAFDMPIPGYDTPSTNNLRLWSSKAAGGEFDFQKFNSGDYESSVADEQRAETISAVLYPNDNLDRGKELRLKQQYFWVAASLYDIVRRFKKSKRAWKEFPEQVAIQLNDTHPTLAIVELQRILLDLEGLEWDEAWQIVTKTVSHLRLCVCSPTKYVLVWIYQSHCSPRSFGEVVGAAIPEPATPSPDDYLRDQPLLSPDCREEVSQRPRNSAPRFHH